jgi:hypothetical protein
LYPAGDDKMDVCVYELNGLSVMEIALVEEATK